MLILENPTLFWDENNTANQKELTTGLGNVITREFIQALLSAYPANQLWKTNNQFWDILLRRSETYVGTRYIGAWSHFINRAEEDVEADYLDRDWETLSNA